MDNYFWGKVAVGVITLYVLMVLLIKHGRSINEAKQREIDRKTRLREQRTERELEKIRARNKESKTTTTVGLGNHKHSRVTPPPPPPPPMRNPNRPEASYYLPSSSRVRDTHRDDSDDTSTLGLVVATAILMSDTSNNTSNYNCPTPSSSDNYDRGGYEPSSSNDYSPSGFD